MTGHSNFRSTHWLTWRAARWVALAAVVPVLWACNSRRLEAPTPAPARTFDGLFQQALNRDIDIVFMVDNSLSMQKLQDKLNANFPAFMDVLTTLPGGLPNVHIGVVSSDMGAGPNDAAAIPGCRLAGDGGKFQSAARGATCGAGMLNAGQNFIIGSNTPGTANFTGTIANAFSCIANLGDGGCGFEHQFASVLRALGADGRGDPPPENAGFLRPNAYLGVILLTNEDDCSAAPDSGLFDPGSTHVSDPLGPLQSYRCNEFGHLCGGARPPRTPAGPTDLSGTCVSAEDGVLYKVADVVTKLRQLKADPSKILVAAIAAPVMPYVVKLTAPTNDDTAMWPFVEHSCVANDGTYGDPAIRVKQWVDAFGANGVFQEICTDSFKPALQVIATKLGMLIGNPCVAGKVLDTAGNIFAAGGAAPADCAVVDHTFNDQGVKLDTPLPSCDSNGNMPPCWHLDAGGMKCPAGNFIMGFNRPAGPPATDLNSSVSCSVRVCPPPTTPVGMKPADCP
jgi:hypothetical protein